MEFPKLRFRLAEPLRPNDLQVTLFWAGLVGFLGACSAALFRVAANEVQLWFWQIEGPLLASAVSIPIWQRLLVPTLGGFAAGLVIQYGVRFARGQSSSDFMEAVAIGEGAIRVRPSLVKSFSSLLTVSSGGSIGREGAMTQLSTMQASWIGRHLAISTPRLKLMVACGAAAGIASAYNAPVAGALFVAEIVLGTIAMESLGPMLFASVVATTTTRQLLGPAPLFSIPAFKLVSPMELFPYLLLGVVLGALAPWFVRLLRHSEQLFARTNAPIASRLALGGLIVGLLSIARPEVWGNGHYAVSEILVGRWTWLPVLYVLIAKLLATAATVGSGAVGGVFTPTLFVGAAFGYLAGLPVHTLWPHSTGEASAYALVGMGAFLAATTHAPLMAILMLFEMTLDYGIVLPLMLACVVAYYTSRGIDARSVYSESLQRKEALAPAPVESQPTVASLVKTRPVIVREGARFDEIVEAFTQHRHNFLFVIDADGRFVGAVSLHDIKAHLNDPVLRHLVIASELMHADFPFLELDSPLGEALEKFLGHDGERLPVVDGHGGRMLVGTISKSDLLLSLSLASKPRAEPARELASK